MTKLQIKEQAVKWWKPILWGVIVPAVFAWAWTTMVKASDRNANDAVWKADVSRDLLCSKNQDTIVSKELKTLNLMFQEFITEVRTDKRNEVMINSLQTAQIEALAEKTFYKKEIDKIKQDYEQLNEKLQSNKSRKSMIMPDTMFQDFSLPCDTVSMRNETIEFFKFFPCTFGILCINP